MLSTENSMKAFMEANINRIKELYLKYEINNTKKIIINQENDLLVEETGGVYVKSEGLFILYDNIVGFRDKSQAFTKARNKRPLNVSAFQ